MIGSYCLQELVSSDDNSDGDFDCDFLRRVGILITNNQECNCFCIDYE